MKHLILLIFTVSVLCSFGQSKSQKDLQKIETVEQASEYIEKIGEKNGEILYLNSSVDTGFLFKKLYTASKGSIVTNNGLLYKIIGKEINTLYRVTYIYLDASKLNLKQIDSIRTFILKKYKSGTAFSKLAQEFNMDGSPKNGDTGFFIEGTMVKEFEDAIKTHKAGDVFNVDIPSNNWYYVVKKTFPNQNQTKVTVLKVQNQN